MVKAQPTTFSNSPGGDKAPLKSGSVGSISSMSSRLTEHGERITQHDKDLLKAFKELQDQKNTMDLVLKILLVMVAAIIVDVLLARIWDKKPIEIIRVYEGSYIPTFQKR
ncbi:MAG: hypothetical protein M1586_00600 [Patescibacteria group bacterium]|nr:hypothetical protein [Patescibacteria group bacterium]MCL5261786.1 hypothetical protein [Patescibacteria group bacterium]